MGSQPNCTPKRIMSRSASQKWGTAKPIKTSTVVILSKKEFWWVADHTPMGMAITRIKANETTLRKIVMGRRSKIFSDTFLPSWEKETPKSRVTRRLIQFQYWIGSGFL